MPKTTNPPAARRHRRGRHREQRLEMLATKPQWLANDAPFGEYRVDFVAKELLLGGAVLSTYGEDKFVRLVREGVSAAASGAMGFTRILLVWRPEKLRLTNRFLHDLRAIQSRIKRN